MFTDYGQILFVADTSALASKRKDDARQIFVFNVGMFEWATTGPANGTTIFAASGSGFWVRKVIGTPPSGQVAIQFKDEGVNQGTLGGINEVNYTGAGVTASVSGAVMTVDIPATGGAGGQTEVFNWKYSTNTAAANPSSGNFRCNDADMADTTLLYINDITSELQIDMSAMFAQMDGKWLLHIQQYNDATKYAQFQIDTVAIGDLVDNSGWWTIPVTHIVSSITALTNLQRCTFVFVNQNSAAGGGGGAGVTDGDKGDVVVSGSGSTWLIEQNLKKESTGVVLDGMGAVILAANTSYGITVVPFACTIQSWDVTANVSGSIVFDVKIGGVSIIGAGNAPTLALAQTNAADVSGWDDAGLAANDKLEFIAVSAATITRVTLTLFLLRT